jgi:hypothetical protein
MIYRLKIYFIVGFRFTTKLYERIGSTRVRQSLHASVIGVNSDLCKNGLLKSLVSIQHETTCSSVFLDSSAQLK